MAGDPNYKVTMMFQDFNQTLGWVENWYVAASGASTALSQATAVAQARCGILCSPNIISYIRISGNLPENATSPPRQRAALLSRVNLQGSYSPTTNSPDTAWQAAKIRFAESTGFVFRTQLMRGLSDDLWSAGTDKIAQARFNAFLPGFVAALVANNFLLRHKNRAAPSSPVYFPIASAQYEGLTRRATGRPLLLPRGRRLAG